MDRREFIKKTGTFLWQTSIYSALIASGKLMVASPEAFADPTDPRAILLRGIRGPVLLPTDPRYAKSATIFSIRHEDIRPTVIALCENEADIVYCLKWAKTYSVPFRVKSGGHSYEAYSSVAGLVIDLSLMNTITLDTNANTATIGAGAKLGQIYQAVAEKNYAFVGGSCPFVGVGGLALGGGFGMLSRKFGLTIDNLIGLRMIAADGTLLNISENENSDLFWACRGGGGGNFGIATQFQFNIHPLINVALFKVTWNPAQAAEAFLNWQNWCETLPNEVTTHFTLSGSGNGITESHMSGQFVGTAAEMNTLLAPLLAAMPSTVEKAWDVSWINSVKYFAGGDTGAPELFKAKSSYVDRAWTESDLAQIIQNITKPGSEATALLFDHYGGAIADIASDATAFPHRAGMKFCIQYYTSWSRANETVARTAALAAFFDSMKPYVSDSSYSNYMDADLKDWATAYYGSNLARLTQIKAQIDPNRVFDFAQAIPKA